MGKVTILGQNIRIVRPEKVNNPIVYKKDRPQARYHLRPKLIKTNLQWIKDSITIPPSPSYWMK